jgi:hypothetical protein
MRLLTPLTKIAKSPTQIAIIKYLQPWFSFFISSSYRDLQTVASGVVSIILATIMPEKEKPSDKF